MSLLKIWFAIVQALIQAASCWWLLLGTRKSAPKKLKTSFSKTTYRVQINILWFGKYNQFFTFYDIVFPTYPENHDTKTQYEKEKGFLLNRETKLILLLQGFPLGLDKWWEHILCKNTKKLQENCKINIFGATKLGGMVGKANFLGSGGRSPPVPH